MTTSDMGRCHFDDKPLTPREIAVNTTREQKYKEDPKIHETLKSLARALPACTTCRGGAISKEQANLAVLRLRSRKLFEKEASARNKGEREATVDQASA